MIVRLAWALVARMYRISIDPEKIGAVIGPGGRVIRAIVEETGCSIDIEDNGSIFIGATNEESAQKAIGRIEGLTKEVEVGTIYTGKVVRIMTFGAFVEILPGKDGLVRLNELSDKPVDRVEGELTIGDEVTVMVIEIDPMGRINLSRRAVLQGISPEEINSLSQRSSQGPSDPRWGNRPRGPAGPSGPRPSGPPRSSDPRSGPPRGYPRPGYQRDPGSGPPRERQ